MNTKLIFMDNGDMFNMFITRDDIDFSKIGNERWIHIKDLQGRDLYINIAHISHIEVRP